jgi:hypothetical protein
MLTEERRSYPVTDQVRERAINRLKKKRGLQAHVLVYLMVNAFVVALWAVNDSAGFFWPIFWIVGWGIGLVMNAWDVYRGDDFDEDQIRREIDRLERVRGSS